MKPLGALAFVLGVAGAMPGGPFALQPSILTATRIAPIAELQFSSLFAQPRVFDVRVLRWTQRDGQDVLAPDDGFIVVPSVFSIEPYQTVIIRIEQRAVDSPPVEQSYKVVVTSVDGGAATPPPTARRLEAMLFVPPAKPAPDPDFELKLTGPQQADLVVTNRGNTHLYLGNVSIGIADNNLYHGSLAGYVLANSTRIFHLRIAGTVSGANANLTFDDTQGRQETAHVTVTR